MLSCVYISFSSGANASNVCCKFVVPSDLDSRCFPGMGNKLKTYPKKKKGGLVSQVILEKYKVGTRA